ncbi:Alcohol dehydrogenase superfamily, zinc-type [Moelleriella libera RCEF 2490]|uniref:Alcohol dehydrogenase superfamily, zinc-type n=1 Tax=Moelleriella libera RCEF 2490 TaxID=1081109 RepID=A0A167WEY5_9HYPO|nr:Alcohol dehydrogenase superfamily, zinc-type [Moelleriella libera RCEF 2490]
MKVIGSTGSKEKVDFIVDDFGFNAAWNYKEEGTAEAIQRLAPKGLDVYYDNVGGEQLELALKFMKDFGTVVVSGAVSVYIYPEEEKYGVRSLMNLFLKRLTTKEEVLIGIDRAAEVLDRVWTGKEFGKMVLKVHEEQEM